MRKVSWFVVVLLFGGILYAQVPKVISYQGRVADAFGNPINGTRNITFRLYSSSSGGSYVWSETHNNVNISNGLYNVMLGSITPFPSSVDFSRQLYLGVMIEPDPELTPRYQLGSSPYAITIADTVQKPRVQTFISNDIEKGALIGIAARTGPYPTHGVTGVTAANSKNASGLYGLGLSDSASGITACGGNVSTCVSMPSAGGSFTGKKYGIYAETTTPTADTVKAIQAFARGVTGPTYGVHAYTEGTSDGPITVSLFGKTNCGGTSCYAGFFDGRVRITGALLDATGDAGENGQVLTSTGTGTNWVSPLSLSQWKPGTRLIYPEINPRIQIQDSTSTYDIYINSNSSEKFRNIYVYSLEPYRNGTGYGPNSAIANIAAYDYNAGKYSFALAGWSYLDSNYTAGVLGANSTGGTFGALAMKIDDTTYAGYFSGTVRINNNDPDKPGLTVRSKTGTPSRTWNLISSKGSGVVLAVSADSSVHNDGVLLLVEKGTGSNRYFLRTDSWKGGWHWVNRINPSGEIEIMADSTARSAIYINNTSSYGNPDTSIIITGNQYTGILIDSSFYAIHIKNPRYGIFVQNSSSFAIGVRDPGNVGFSSAFYSGAPPGAAGFYGYTADNTDTTAYFMANMRVTGHVYSGSLMRVIPRGDGTGLATPAVSATAHYVEHIGEAHLHEGFARIELPSYFTDITTINDENKMQVFITPYGDLGRYKVERGKNYFIVRQLAEGDSEAEFAYRVVAKSRGSEDETVIEANLKAEELYYGEELPNKLLAK